MAKNKKSNGPIMSIDTEVKFSQDLIENIRTMLNQLENNLSDLKGNDNGGTPPIIPTPPKAIKAKRTNDVTNGKVTVRAGSGVKGVHKHTSGKWCAKFYINSEEIYVGLYTSISEAKKEIERAKRTYISMSKSV
jgi:hypothetical protein